jgi:hypothetical protein
MKAVLRWSSVLFLFLQQGINFAFAQYCIPTYINSCSTEGSINKFTFNTLNNNVSGCNGNPDNYILYASTGSTTTAVTVGSEYDLSVKSGSDAGFGIWIDYNNDTDFNDEGEFVYSSPFFDNILFTGSVVIPNNSSFIGERRMRVRSGLETLLYDYDACTTFPNGETEDYVITIEPAPPCSGIPVAGTITAFPSSICTEGNSSELYLNGYSIASDIFIQWESSADGLSWTEIPGATSPSYITPPQFDTTWYRAKVTCTISSDFSYSNEVKITIGQVHIDTVINDTLCGAGVATLQVSANANSISWYEDATGGIPLFTSASPSVFTPSVDTTTTFFASASSGILYIDSTGLYDNTAGSGSDAYKNDFLSFSVIHSFKLVGVYVYPGAEGIVIVQLRDKFNDPLQTDTFSISALQVNQKTFLELDYDLSNGTGYQLTLKDGSVPLWSNQSGVNYPYEIPGVLSITGSNLGPNYYFYYYNWIINYTDQCETPREPVVAVVDIAPDLFITTNPPDPISCANSGDSITLTASGGYDNYTWSPSSGLSSISGAEVKASPNVTTTYTVLASDSICENQATSTVVIANTPSVVITASPDSICGGISTQLFATATPLLNYNVEQIPFDPDSGVGTEVLLDEDEVSEALPIGFVFKFYGSYYTTFKISSNGFITFDSISFDGCCAGQKLPDISQPNNLLALAWEDLSPQLGGTVSYFTSGVLPNRKLVIRFDSVLHYSLSGGDDPVTMQAILYESSNTIEVHTTSMPGNPNGLWFTHTMGIENTNGTVGTSVPGRNGLNSWTASEDAWRFTPIDYSYSWSPGSSLNDAFISDPIATPLTTTNYTLTVTDTASQCAASSTIKIQVITNPVAGSIDPAFHLICDEGTDTLSLTGYTSGATIQWQESATSGGPYTDIAGATSSSLITPLLNSTVYYVAEVTCTNPTLSSESILEVMPVPSPPSGDTSYRCGPGKIDLVATGSGGTLSWYDNDSAGTYLGSGSPFTTLPITQSTTFWVEEGPPIASPLSTTFIGGGITDGNMFDITALNTIEITSFDGNLDVSQVADIEIYYRKGSYSGYENDEAAWTLLGSATAVIGQGIGIPTPFPIPLAVTIPAGKTYSFYITSKVGGINATAGTVAGAIFDSDDNIQVAEGNKINYPFGSFEEPSQWNGIIHYKTDGCSSDRAAVEAIVYHPEINAAVSDAEICKGDSVTLMVQNIGEGDYDYQWSPLLVSMNPPNGEGENVVVAPETSTTFTVIATELSNSCDTAILVQVIVFPNPVTSFSGLNDTMLITDDPAVLTGIPPGGIFTGEGISGNIFDPVQAGLGGPYPISYAYTDANGCFDDTVQWVTVAMEVGIDEQFNDASVQLFPNPASGQVSLIFSNLGATEKINIEIRDMYGRLMTARELTTTTNPTTFTFDLTNWAKGNYFLSAQVGGERAIRRLTIQ